MLRFAHRNSIEISPVTESLKKKTLLEAIGLFAAKRKILLGIRINGQQTNETINPNYIIQARDEFVYIDMA